MIYQAHFFTILGFTAAWKQVEVVTPQLAYHERLGPIITNLHLFLEAVLQPNFYFSVICDLLIKVFIQKIDLSFLNLDPNWAIQETES